MRFSGHVTFTFIQWFAFVMPVGVETHALVVKEGKVDSPVAVEITDADFTRCAGQTMLIKWHKIESPVAVIAPNEAGKRVPPMECPTVNMNYVHVAIVVHISWNASRELREQLRSLREDTRHALIVEKGQSRLFCDITEADLSGPRLIAVDSQEVCFALKRKVRGRTPGSGDEQVQAAIPVKIQGHNGIDMHLWILRAV